MKKSLKKIITVVLTFAMMFAMTVPAYAKEAFKILKTNATIYSSKTMENRRCYNPDELIYVVDKRQELYFTQVFRCARKTGIVKPETELKLGYAPKSWHNNYYCEN